MNVNFKVKIDKREAGKDEFLGRSQEISPRESREDDLRQTLSRSRRPPELNIKKKSDKLRESIKKKQEKEDVNAMKET